MNIITNYNSFENKLLKLGLKGKPTAATLELTSHCNGSCNYCYIKDLYPTELSTEEWLKTLYYLKKQNILKITLSGGEPFLRNDIDIILKTAAKNFWQLHIMTNATAITDEHIEIILKYAPTITDVQISIFSIEPHIHDSYIKIKGGLEKALKTIKKLRTNNIPVTISLNAVMENMETINKTSEYFYERNFSVIYGISKYECSNNFNCSNIKESHTTIDFYKKLLNKIPDFLLKKEMDRIKKHIRLYNKYNKDNKQENILCNGIFTSITITPNGDIYPCSMLRKRKEFLLGNITDKPDISKEISKNKALQNLHNTKREDIKQCANCALIRKCNLCPALILEESDNIKNPPEQTVNYINAIVEVGGIKYDIHCKR